jgi:bis(5'-nucleosidyl)-tetraphosphatase
MGWNHGTPPEASGQIDPDRAAGIILYRRAADGSPRFLLLETRKGGHYSPPKGHLEADEGLAAAALRECAEECGLRPLSIDPSFQETIAYQVVKKGRPRRKEVSYFLGEANGSGEVILSDEHTGARWEPLDQVLRLIEFETLRGVFRRAAAHLQAGA